MRFETSTQTNALVSAFDFVGNYLMMHCLETAQVGIIKISCFFIWRYMKNDFLYISQYLFQKGHMVTAFGAIFNRQIKSKLLQANSKLNITNVHQMCLSTIHYMKHQELFCLRYYRVVLPGWLSPELVTLLQWLNDDSFRPIRYCSLVTTWRHRSRLT